MHVHLSMYLPRPDGTRHAFCDNGIRRVRPCTEYVIFNENNTLIKGHVVHTDTNQPRFFCSWKCVAYYANMKQKGT